VGEQCRPHLRRSGEGILLEVESGEARNERSSVGGSGANAGGQRVVIPQYDRRADVLRRRPDVDQRTVVGAAVVNRTTWRRRAHADVVVVWIGRVAHPAVPVFVDAADQDHLRDVRGPESGGIVAVLVAGRDGDDDAGVDQVAYPLRELRLDIRV